MQKSTFGSAVALLALVAGGPALADVIDGNWCSTDGRHLQIDGTTIITPGGHQITGDYGRHTFSYSVPSSEPSPGATVFMRLMNETTVDVWVGAASTDPATAEIWKRCTPVASLPRPQPIFG